MFCTNCGKEIPEKIQICENCGKQLKTTETEDKIETTNPSKTIRTIKKNKSCIS